MSNNGPVTAAIVGAGHRSLLYAAYALDHPDELKIVAVAEPNEFRRLEAAKTHNIPENMCFDSAEALAAQPKVADAIINGTMDRFHVQTTLPFIAKGYHVLLEKPIGVSEEEVEQVWEAAKEHDRTVMICHVLRYAPFYVEIRKKLADGAIGEIISLETNEYVGFDLMSAGFIRGKWSRMAWAGSEMLMSKCCHDLDLITWMQSGIPPTSVCSLGSLMHFRPEKAPEGSGTRCLLDCKIEPDCPYSAKKIYIDRPGIWDPYVWAFIEGGEPTLERQIESLNTDNPHGLCAWKAGNEVVDHQSVIIEFANGSTATHNMLGGTMRSERTIHIIGTKGEMSGMLGGDITLKRFDNNAACGYTEEVVPVQESDLMHGGGDLGVIEDFTRVLRGESTSISSTMLEDSIYGHLIGFAADRARHERRVEEIRRL